MYFKGYAIFIQCRKVFCLTRKDLNFILISLYSEIKILIVVMVEIK